MAEVRKPTQKKARRTPYVARTEAKIRLPQSVAEELRSALAATKARKNDWLVQAIQAALLAQAENRSMSRLGQIQDKAEVISVDVLGLKRRQEELHSLVRGVEKAQQSELGEAFQRLGEALTSIDKRVEGVEAILQGQRLLMAALILGSTEHTRGALNRIMADPGNLGQMISDWRGSR